MASVAAALVGAAPAAQAAPANWSGFYVGGSIGADFLTSNRSSSANPVFWSGFGTDAVSTLNATAPATYTKESVMGDVRVGYNWQHGPLVLGLLADIATPSPDATHSTGILPAPTLSPGMGTHLFAYTSQARNTATVRAVLGHSFGATLVTISAGPAWATIRQSGHVEFDSACGGPNPGCDADAGSSTTRTGWAVGASLEHKINMHWSWKAEYVHEDFGSESANLPNLGCCTGSSFAQTLKVTEDTPSLGLNYRF
jgi:outer membrane immunogenic protein